MMRSGWEREHCACCAFVLPTPKPLDYRLGRFLSRPLRETPASFAIKRAAPVWCSGGGALAFRGTCGLDAGRSAAASSNCRGRRAKWPGYGSSIRAAKSAFDDQSVSFNDRLVTIRCPFPSLTLLFMSRAYLGGEVDELVAVGVKVVGVSGGAAGEGSSAI